MLFRFTRPRFCNLFFYWSPNFFAPVRCVEGMIPFGFRIAPTFPPLLLEISPVISRIAMGKGLPTPVARCCKTAPHILLHSYFFSFASRAFAPITIPPLIEKNVPGDVYSFGLDMGLHPLALIRIERQFFFWSRLFTNLN